MRQGSWLRYKVLSDEERTQAEDVVKQILARKSVPSGSKKMTFSKFMEGFVMGSGHKAGQLCVSGGMALVTGGASLILESGELRSAGGGIAKALQSARSLFAERKAM